MTWLGIVVAVVVAALVAWWGVAYFVARAIEELTTGDDC